MPKTQDPFLQKWGLVSQSQLQKYDRFVQAFMTNSNATESYTIAFDATTVKANKAGGYELMKHPYIIDQLQIKNKELDEKLGPASVLNRERLLQELEEILLLAKDNENYLIALKSLDQIAKVIGAYSPVKVEAEVNNGITINYIKPEQKTIKI